MIGDGSGITNIDKTLQQITDTGNTTSNTLQFTNTDTSFIASGNIHITGNTVSHNIQLTDPGITASIFNSNVLVIDGANKTYGTGPVIELQESNIEHISYTNLINGSQIVIPVVGNTNGTYYITSPIANVNYTVFESDVSVPSSNHCLITISNIYNNIYMNATLFKG